MFPLSLGLLCINNKVKLNFVFYFFLYNGNRIHFDVEIVINKNSGIFADKINIATKSNLYRTRETASL